MFCLNKIGLFSKDQRIYQYLQWALAFTSFYKSISRMRAIYTLFYSDFKGDYFKFRLSCQITLKLSSLFKEFNRSSLSRAKFTYLSYRGYCIICTGDGWGGTVKVQKQKRFKTSFFYEQVTTRPTIEKYHTGSLETKNFYKQASIDVPYVWLNLNVILIFSNLFILIQPKLKHIKKVLVII